MLVQHNLVPFDFSPYAEHAFAYALGLAQPLQARLTLLHVIDATPLGVVEGAAMLPPSYWQALERGIAQSLEELLTRVEDCTQRSCSRGYMMRVSKGRRRLCRASPFKPFLIRHATKA